MSLAEWWAELDSQIIENREAKRAAGGKGQRPTFTAEEIAQVKEKRHG